MVEGHGGGALLEESELDDAALEGGLEWLLEEAVALEERAGSLEVRLHALAVVCEVEELLVRVRVRVRFKVRVRVRVRV